MVWLGLEELSADRSKGGVMSFNSVVVVVVVVASEPRVQSVHGPATAAGVPATGVQGLAHKDAWRSSERYANKLMCERP